MFKYSKILQDQEDRLHEERVQAFLAGFEAGQNQAGVRSKRAKKRGRRHGLTAACPPTPKEARHIKIRYAGDPCRKCGEPVVEKPCRRFKKRGDNAFKWYLYCPRCRTIYFVKDGLNEQRAIRPVDRDRQDIASHIAALADECSAAQKETVTA